MDLIAGFYKKSVAVGDAFSEHKTYEAFPKAGGYVRVFDKFGLTFSDSGFFHIINSFRDGEKCYLNVSIMLSTEGPISIMKITGKISRSIGISILIDALFPLSFAC